MAPREFIRQELSLTPSQKKLTLRIFSLLMLLCILSVATRVPTSRQFPFFLALLMTPIMNTRRASLTGLWQFTGSFGASIMLALLTILLTQDQGWMRLPFGFVVLTLILFHARKTRTGNFVGIFYAASVFTGVADPVTEMVNALWLITTLMFPVILIAGMTGYVLWPQSSRSMLEQRIRDQFNRLEGLLDALIKPSTPVARFSNPGMIHQNPGWISDAMKLLDDAIKDDPPLMAVRHRWTTLLMELDALNGGLSEIVALKGAEPPSVSTQSSAAETYQGLKIRIQGAREHFEACITSPTTQDAAPQPATASPSPSSFGILQRVLLTTERLEGTLARLNEPSPDDLVDTGHSGDSLRSFLWHLADSGYWKENRQMLLWATKVAVACIAVVLIVESLNASRINTAIATTIIVAESTLGADYRKSLLRIIGATLGGILGLIWLILCQPMADTVAGLLVTLAPFMAFTAWMCAASPRINYVGIQTGLALCLIVFSTQEPTTHPDEAWYRVLGVLLGITVMGVVDYLLWPARSIEMAQNRLIAILKALRDLMQLTPGTHPLDSQRSSQLIRLMDQQLQEALYFLQFAQLEPDSALPSRAALLHNTGLLAQQVHRLARIIQGRHRLFLNAEEPQALQWIRQGLNPCRQQYVTAFDAMARALESNERMPPATRIRQTLTANLPSPLSPESPLYALKDLEHTFSMALLELYQRVESMTGEQPEQAPQPEMTAL